MDRKLLYKANLMGNSVMRKNRVEKSKTDRNLRRKELFSHGRDIVCSPAASYGAAVNESQDPKNSRKGKSVAQKADETAKKEETYRARFAVYLEEKRKRLAEEKAKKKPPFLSAVVGQKSAFEFALPKPVKSNVSRQKSRQISTQRSDSGVNSQTRVLRSSKNNSKPSEKVIEKKIKVQSQNLQITKPAAKKTKTSVVSDETPLPSDKTFSFNNIGSAVTSTLRKDLTEPSNPSTSNIEDTLSPIEGIAPLEASIINEAPPSAAIATKRRSSLLGTPSKSNKTQNQDNVPTEEEKKPVETFYLSPFVSTIRGKGSAQKEKRNRESLYQLNLNYSLEELADVKRKREAIKYFRKVLADEMERLTEQGNVWSTYRDENAENFEEHCSDMINVATGQMKLLISGRFKVFTKLIDDCEKTIADRRKSVAFDPEARDIMAEDLEGFWTIVKLQIENVDKRFESLTAWKNNNWKDPQEASRTKKSTLAKSMKAKKPTKKRNPSDQIKSVIMAAHRQYLKNRQQNTLMDQDVIFVSRNGTQNPVSVKTIDMSSPPGSNAVETAEPKRVRLIKTPYRVSSSSATTENRILTPAQRRLSILRAGATTGSGSRSKSRLSETPKSAPPRKSILKSVNGNSLKKNVLFSERIDYCSPSRRSTRSSGTANQSMNGSFRLMELRSRNVLMRDDVSD